MIFIAVSGVMNALFFASLGRTLLEALLLAAVSIASDLVKAVLPIVLVRAIVLRKWGQGCIAATMLVMVIASSLASGTGFAALTRAASTSIREARVDKLAGNQKELRELDAKSAALPSSRPAGLIEAELSGLQTDRRWLASAACRETTNAATRTFCSAYFKLRAELEAAKEHADIDARRQLLRWQVETLRAEGAAGGVDPQAGAIGNLLGINEKTARVGLTVFVAVLLEIGSVVLILLAAGPTLSGWREPGDEPARPFVAAQLAEQADRTHWRRQHGKDGAISGQRTGSHVQQ